MGAITYREVARNAALGMPGVTLPIRGVASKMAKSDPLCFGFYVRPKGRIWAFKFNPGQKLKALFGWSSIYQGNKL